MELRVGDYGYDINFSVVQADGKTPEDLTSVLEVRFQIVEVESHRNIVDGVCQMTDPAQGKCKYTVKKQKALLQKELEEVNNFADSIMNKWTTAANEDNTVFIREKLDKLGKRRKEIEAGIISLDDMVAEIKKEAVNQELVMQGLSKFAEVFDSLTPHEQKDLLRLILHKAYLGPESIKLALYGRPAGGWQSDDLCKCLGDIRSVASDWQRQRGSNP